MPTWGNGPIIPHAPTGRYGKIGPCGNSAQFGSPGGRFRKAETELKLHGGFKPFSIAFARVNKQEYKYENRFSQYLQPRMPPNCVAQTEYICLHCCNTCYNASMKLIEAIRATNDIASSQRGLFTSAQAKVLGVEWCALSRLEGLGNIERLAKGAYRMGGSPSTREENVLAA